MTYRFIKASPFSNFNEEKIIKGYANIIYIEFIITSILIDTLFKTLWINLHSTVEVKILYLLITKIFSQDFESFFDEKCFLALKKFVSVLSWIFSKLTVVHNQVNCKSSHAIVVKLLYRKLSASTVIILEEQMAMIIFSWLHTSVTSVHYMSSYST